MAWKVIWRSRLRIPTGRIACEILTHLRSLDARMPRVRHDMELTPNVSARGPDGSLEANYPNWLFIDTAETPVVETLFHDRTIDLTVAPLNLCTSRKAQRGTETRRTELCGRATPWQIGRIWRWLPSRHQSALHLPRLGWSKNILLAAVVRERANQNCHARCGKRAKTWPKSFAKRSA